MKKLIVLLTFFSACTSDILEPEIEPETEIITVDGSWIWSHYSFSSELNLSQLNDSVYGVMRISEFNASVYSPLYGSFKKDTLRLYTISEDFDELYMVGEVKDTVYDALSYTGEDTLRIQYIKQDN